MDHSRNGHAERLGRELLRLKATGQLKAGAGTAAIEAAEKAVDRDRRLGEILKLAADLKYVALLKPADAFERIREVVEKIKNLLGEK